MQPTRMPSLLRADAGAQNLLYLLHIEPMQVNLIASPISVVYAKDVVPRLAVVVVTDTVVLFALVAELLCECFLPRRVCRAGALRARLAFCVGGVPERP